MSKIDIETIEVVADLARLKLNDKEKEKYAGELSVIFDYVETLSEVETNGVEETCQVTGLDNVFREDVVVECDPETRMKLIKQFPEKLGEFLKVKAVFKD